MFLRVAFFLLLTLVLSAQNNLIIFSSTTNHFNVKCNEINLKDTFQQEVKIESILKDTLHLSFSLEKGNSNLKYTIFLLEKGKNVQKKEFIYSFEFNANTKKLKLIFIAVNDIDILPNPLLPSKPKEDTTYKWRNNVYGNLFELKEGKPEFFFNVPKDGVCIKAMPDENVVHAIKLMVRTQIDLEKYKFAREVVKSNCISCKQLSQILKVLNFELDKLKLLKESYNTIVDKSNLKTLEECFKFESSKKEFKDILSNPNSMILKNKISCVIAEKDSIINGLIDALRLFSTDYEKYQYMKEKASVYCFSTNQFKNTLIVFMHDREKLDLTKQFYNNITDKEKLINLKDVFSYQESNANLIDFLKQNN